MPQLLEAEEEYKEKTGYVMSAEESLYYNSIINKIKKAKEQRDQPRKEFDDVTYEQDYITNQLAVNTYLRPKKNDDEVRVNTPVTEKKVESVLNELLSINLQPEVRAYNEEDSEMVELGDAISDVVTRTNEIEDDDDKMIDISLELLAQRAIFIEELFIEEDVVIHLPGGKKKIQTVRKYEKRPVSGLQIYVGDINMPAWRFRTDQPYVIKYERMLYDVAFGIYGHFPMWKYVTKGAFTPSSEANPFSYRMNSIQGEEVEILHYMSYKNDEYQCVINGVMMYPIKQSYREIVGELNGYHISAVVPKPMKLDFFYGRSLVSSAKVIQALDNETFRNLIRKFRQAVEPPVGTKSGKIFSRDIWNAGSVAQGVSAKDFELLINHQGVTPGEMGMLQLIEKMTSDFIGQSNAVSQKSRVTAKEVIAAGKETLKMLGLSVLAMMRLKRELTFARIGNIIWNSHKVVKKVKNDYTNEIENVYQRFTANEAKLGDGKTGKKIVQFTDKNLSREDLEDIYQYEESETKATGVPTRFVAIDINKLQAVKTNFKVVVSQKERDSSDLAKAMFQDKLNNFAMVTQMTGRRLNADKVVEETERIYQSKGLFERAAPAGLEELGPMPAEMGKAGSEVGAQLNKSETASNRKPTINTMTEMV